MTITPKLSSENIDYVFSVAGRILSESSERLPSTPGEAYSARLILNELKKYCDETSEESFTRPWLRKGAAMILRPWTKNC